MHAKASLWVWEVYVSTPPSAHNIMQLSSLLCRSPLAFKTLPPTTTLPHAHPLTPALTILACLPYHSAVIHTLNTMPPLLPSATSTHSGSPHATLPYAHPCSHHTTLLTPLTTLPHNPCSTNISPHFFTTLLCAMLHSPLTLTSAPPPFPALTTLPHPYYSSLPLPLFSVLTNLSCPYHYSLAFTTLSSPSLSLLFSLHLPIFPVLNTLPLPSPLHFSLNCTYSGSCSQILDCSSLFCISDNGHRDREDESTQQGHR